MKPFLSIVIPTKNRYEYLKVILEVIKNFRNEDLEIVIQDNSDNPSEKDDFFSYVNGLNDSSIKYFYCNENLSINENSDKAVLNSKGKYVCFIGDDDCVTSHIVDAARWMESQAIDVLTFYCPSYIWSDVDYKYLSKRHTGILEFKQPTGKILIKDPKKELFRLLRIGGQNIREMPQLYHGIASREILDKIFEVTGSFFPGSVPDMDVAVCLAIYANKCFKIDVPLVIAGTAKRSAGGLGAAKMHKGDINKIATLPKNTAKTWNPYIPFFWSGPTIYADSITKCLVKTGNANMMDMFNYNYLYALLFVFHSDFYREIKKTLKLNKETSRIKILYFAFVFFSLRLFSFISNRMPQILKMKKNKIKIPTISEAVSYLQGIINEMTLPWHNN